MPTWTTKQIRELSEAWRDGEELQVLAERFNRTPGALAAVLHREGVKRTPAKLRELRKRAQGDS